jgi:hypothetical protein
MSSRREVMTSKSQWNREIGEAGRIRCRGDRVELQVIFSPPIHKVTRHVLCALMGRSYQPLVRWRFIPRTGEANSFANAIESQQTPLDNGVTVDPAAQARY